MELTEIPEGLTCSKLAFCSNEKNLKRRGKERNKYLTNVISFSTFRCLFVIDFHLAATFLPWLGNNIPPPPQNDFPVYNELRRLLSIPTVPKIPYI